MSTWPKKKQRARAKAKQGAKAMAAPPPSPDSFDEWLGLLDHRVHLVGCSAVQYVDLNKTEAFRQAGPGTTAG